MRGDRGDGGDPAGDATIRPARPADLAAVEALLVAADLPRAGVPEWLPRFVVVERAGAIVAAAGMELYGRAALLRSVVVSRELRGSGIGAELTRRIAADAAAAGARMLYLLTTTAAEYFPRLGFERITRADLPEALSASEEMRGACPVTAVVMARPLRR
jgi:N-acetylglutamate synthase-like GNAT family acetyltransferase